MKHSNHYQDILDWVKSFVRDDEEATGLTNQIHYLSVKQQRKAVAMGILIGWLTFAILLQWVR